MPGIPGKDGISGVPGTNGRNGLDGKDGELIYFINGLSPVKKLHGIEEVIEAVQ